MPNQVIEINVEGFADLKNKIKRLANDKDKRREVTAILRKAAASTVAVARAEAPKGSGKIKDKKRKYRYLGKTRSSYTPGEGAKAINVQVMRKAKIPMVVVRANKYKNTDAFYLRQFVIPGHNIYSEGFKRNKKGSQEINATGTKKRIHANPFMDRAQNKTQGQVTAAAVPAMEKFLQKRINLL